MQHQVIHIHDILPFLDLRKRYSMVILASVAQVFGRRGFKVSVNGCETASTNFSASIKFLLSVVYHQGFLDIDPSVFQEGSLKSSNKLVPTDRHFYAHLREWFDNHQVQDGYKVTYTFHAELFRALYSSQKSQHLLLELYYTLAFAEFVGRYRGFFDESFEIVGEHIVRDDLFLELSYSAAEASVTSAYSYIVSVLESDNDLAEHVNIYVNKDVGSLDWYLFQNKAYDIHHRQKWSVEDKRQQLSVVDYKPGDILVLWTTKNNRWGTTYIDDYSIVEYLGVTPRNEIRLKKYPIPNTKHESFEQFSVIDEHRKYLFKDIYTKKPQPLFESFPLLNVAVDTFYYDEIYILSPLDAFEEGITKSFTDSEGVPVSLEMSARDAVFLYFHSWDLEFDWRRFYSRYYRDGALPVWFDYFYEEDLPPVEEVMVSPQVVRKPYYVDGLR